MHEIKPTDKSIYWVARNDDGSVLHSGVTYPGQETITGQNNFITGGKVNQTTELEKYLGKRPSKDYVHDHENRTWVKSEVIIGISI